MKLYKWRNRLDVACTDPGLAVKAMSVFFTSRLRVKKSPKILVGTHHKVLSVFMTRIFSDFANITNRTISIGMAENVDYKADIIFDHHSQFDFSKITCEYVGLHFRRDPRDLVVSAGFYHKRSDEPQLHIPLEELGGKTYQEYVNALESMEEVFLFELDHSAAYNIRHMLEWDYDRGFQELKYEDIVTPEGGAVFRQAINQWPSPKTEKSLLGSLFNFYSIFGKAGKKNVHVRDPRSKQYQKHFTEKLYREFEARFADAPTVLGYD
ncbi:MAG: hypothetical protein JXR49_16280 [Acidobacteria bacterium]|nr:hypothetical protein [Acidobacteriota bacterium]